MAVAAAVALGLLALCGRYLFGSWLAPAAFVPLFWAAVFEAAAVLAPSYSLTFGAWVIVALMGCFVVGSIPIRPPRRGLPRPSLPNRPRTAGWVRTLNVLSLLGILILVRHGITALGVSLSPSGLLQLGNRYSLARYGGGGTPVVPFLVASLCFPACLLAGRLWPGHTGREQRLAILAVALVVVLSLITGARSSLLFGAAFFVAGLLAASVYRGGSRTRVKPRTVLLVAGLGLLVPLVSGFFLQVRAGYTEVDQERVSQVAALYTVGSVAGFSVWYDSADPGLSWGTETLAGPASLAGLTDRVQGLYADAVVIDEGATINVYTAFRPLVSDFSLAGAMLVMAATGLVAAKAYRAVAHGRTRSWLWLSMVYAAALMSPVVSMFAYNNVAFTWLVALVALWRVDGNRGRVVLTDRVNVRV